MPGSGDLAEDTRRTFDGLPLQKGDAFLLCTYQRIELEALA